MNRGGGCLVLMIVFVMTMVSVSAIPQTINIHGKLSGSEGALEGTYSMNFSIYNVSSGGSYLYKKNMSVTTDSAGVYNAILDNVDLNFDEQYYLGIAVEDDAEMVPRINLTSSPYAYMAQNVSAGGIIFDENVDAGAQNITTTGTGFFGFLGSLVTRISKLWVDEINATGNIVTVGNVSAGYYIGDGSLLTGTGTGDADYSFGSNDFNGSGNFTTTGNITAENINATLFNGIDLSALGSGDTSYDFGSNDFNGSGNFTTTGNITAENINATLFNGIDLSALGTGDADYSFGANDFNGTGNFTTTGNITAGNINATLFNGIDLSALGSGDTSYDFGSNDFNGTGNFTTTGNITAENINATLFNGIDLSALGTGDADYSFGANDFNGTGNFTTTGNITADTYFGDGLQLTGSAGVEDSDAPDVLTVTGGLGGYAGGGAGAGIGGDIRLTAGVGGSDSGEMVPSADGGGVYLTAGIGGSNVYGQAAGDGGNIELTTGAGGSGSPAGSYGNIILVKNGGYIGIGTITPTHELNVIGGVNITENVTADYFIGNGSQLTGIGGADYEFTTNNFNGSGNFITTGNVNATLFNGIDLSALGSGDASYEFGANNFNGSGDFTTTGIGKFGDLNVTGTFYTDTINSSSAGNVTITSAGGNVIIKLG